MSGLSSQVVVLDCEASGLSDESYPISIGVCGPDMQSWYWLICPLEDWEYWDSFSETIHGIERDVLLEQGRDAFLVAREMNAIFKGLSLTVDSEWDSFWVKKLFEDSGVKMGFDINFVAALLSTEQQADYTEWAQSSELSHHAMQDAAVIREKLVTYVTD